MSADSETVAIATPRSQPEAFYDPLRCPRFRTVWLAAVICLSGSWMHDVGSSWFMRELSNSDPLMVSLIQSALSLPIMLLSLPMGTLGDLIDRRRFLLIAHVWLVLILLVLAFLTATERVTPGLLVLLTAALGIGKAMTLPGFAAVVPEIVRPEKLHLGVGLYSMANNGARILGPAAAGLLLAAAGAAPVYAVSVVMVLISFSLLLRWQRPPRPAGRAGSFLSGLRSGIAYAFKDAAYRRVILRIITFFLCVSSVHALLPLLVNDPTWFGFAWGAYGLGAIVAAMVFPRFANAVDSGHQLTLAIASHAVFLALLAMTEVDWAKVVLLFVLGSCWFLAISSAQLAAQRILPEALRARGMGIFTTVVMAGFGLGAPLWGLLARQSTVAVTLAIAAGVSLLALTATRRLRW